MQSKNNKIKLVLATRLSQQKCFLPQKQCSRTCQCRQKTWPPSNGTISWYIFMIAL